MIPILDRLANVGDMVATFPSIGHTLVLASMQLDAFHGLVRRQAREAGNRKSAAEDQRVISEVHEQHVASTMTSARCTPISRRTTYVWNDTRGLYTLHVLERELV